LEGHKKFAFDLRRDYFDHGNCVGWTREGLEDQPGSGCAVLLSNGDEGDKSMEVGLRFKGTVFIDILGNNSTEVTIDDAGWGEFYVNGGSISLWVERKL